MANTYQIIQTVTVGAGGAASIDFSSIPQTYTDLKILLSGRTNANDGSSGQWTYINFNGATTNNSVRVLYGAGSSVGQLAATSNTIRCLCKPFKLYI